MKYYLGNKYDTLIEIFKNTDLAGSSRNTSQAEAKALDGAISKFTFVVSLVTWYNILFEINPTSKLLQSKEHDLDYATRLLQVTKNSLVNCRCDECVEQILTDATEIAKELDRLLYLRLNM